MTRFNFRLAGLLKLREAARDARRLQLSEALHAAALLRQELQRIEEELAALRDSCRQAAGPGLVDLDRLREAQRFEALLKARRQEVRLELERTEEQIEHCRLKVVEADRDVKVLENLSAKQSQRHVEKEHRREIGVLDEAAARLCLQCQQGNGGQAPFVRSTRRAILEKGACPPFPGPFPGTPPVWG
jgi:flagellar protein FliJ